PDLAQPTWILQQTRRQEAAQRYYLALLPNSGSGGDGGHIGQTQGARFRRSNQGRDLDWNFGYDHSEKERDGIGERLQAGPSGGPAISQRYHHRRRALQQDHRHLDARRGSDF